ncbi:ALP1-like protein [Tanacetum coccineum]
MPREWKKLSSFLAPGTYGANNDINVLDNSPLFDDLLDDKALVAPYVVNGVEFEKGYYIADGDDITSQDIPVDSNKTFSQVRQLLSKVVARFGMSWRISLRVGHCFEEFGFGRTWCNWIRGTLTSAKASILINGSPSKEYSCHRVSFKKQGDSSCHFYLFLIWNLFIYLSKRGGDVVVLRYSIDQAWDDAILKLRSASLSGKVKTLSIRAEVSLKVMESIRRGTRFFMVRRARGKSNKLKGKRFEISGRTEKEHLVIVMDSRFWFDCMDRRRSSWVVKFLGVFAFGADKEASVAVKLSLLR